MAATSVASLRFKDCETGEDGGVYIRATPGWIGICLSLDSNGDLEVSLQASDVKDLVESLQRAIAIAEERSGR